MKLKAVIIDDEQAAVDTLSAIINKTTEGIKIAGIADSVSSGLKMISDVIPDVVFLDIHMSDGTGFDLLKQLKNIKFKIIFTTAYNDYALKAIKFSALDYLLKPIDENEFREAIDKLEEITERENMDLKMEAFLNNMNPLKKERKKIILNTLESVDIVEVAEIVRCEAHNNYTQFYLLSGNKLLISKTLKEYEKLLTSEGFFRSHSAHLINLKYIQKIDKRNGSQVIMKDKSIVPVSVRKKDELLDILETL